MQKVKWNIELKGHIYPCIVSFKKMKTIRVKIRDNYLEVSAPVGTSEKYIRDLIYENEEDLYARLSSYVPYFDLREDGYVYIFGKKYQIVVRDIKKKQCAIHGDSIYVYTSYIENVLGIYLSQILYEYLKTRTAEYLPLFNRPMPRIQIKQYKGRWGSCYDQLNFVTFNFSLVYLDKELIDYVIVHELCHFIEPNHSLRFYAEVKKRMPDYKKRMKILEEKHV